MADKPQSRKTDKKRKTRWVRPAVRSGRLFESNSLSCGKSSPGLPECQEQNATSS